MLRAHRLLLIIAFASLHISPAVAVAFDDVAPRTSKDGLTYYATLKNCEARLELDTPFIYLLKDDASETHVAMIKVSLKQGDKLADYVAGVFNVDGKPVDVSIANVASTLKVEKHGDIGTIYTFSKEGTEEIKVQIGADSVRVPVTVTRLEFKKGDPAKALIEKYGFPTERKKIFVDWPNLETHDDLIYRPEAGNAVILEHWRFEKVQDAVFVINNEKVVDVHGNTKKVPLQRQSDDWFPKVREPLDLGGMALGPNDGQEKQPASEYSKWVAVDGSTFEGKFVRMLSGDVVMEVPNGQQVKIRLSKFRPEDIAKIRELSKAKKSGN